MVRELFLMAR